MLWNGRTRWWRLFLSYTFDKDGMKEDPLRVLVVVRRLAMTCLGTST